jgi:hypothetical protein
VVWSISPDDRLKDMRDFAFGHLAQVQQAGEEIARLKAELAQVRELYGGALAKLSFLTDELAHRMDPGELLGGDNETWIDEQIEIGMQEDENERASVREDLRSALQRLDEMCDHLLEKNCEEEADDERQEVDRPDDNELRAGADDAQMVDSECQKPVRQVDYVAEEVARRMRAGEDLSCIPMMMQIGKTDVWRKAEVARQLGLLFPDDYDESGRPASVQRLRAEISKG